MFGSRQDPPIPDADAIAIARALDAIGRHRRAANPTHRNHHEHHAEPHGRHRHEGPRRHLGVHRLLEALVDAGEPMSITELGAAIGVDQPRASRLVRELQDGGLVRRQPDAADARRSNVALTEAGRRRTSEHRERRAAPVVAALGTLEPAERAELARLLQKLVSAWQ